MAISVRNKQVEELARRLAYERGESITDAILEALETRLNHLGPESRLTRDVVTMENTARRIAAMPVMDERTAEEIIGYNQDGLPA